jgi:hypothetical protein
LASQNAGVTVVIVGLTRDRTKQKYVIDGDQIQMVTEIGPYLTSGSTQIIEPRSKPMDSRPQMFLGNMAKDGGHLIFDRWEKSQLINDHKVPSKFVRDFWGAYELMRGVPRCCLWLLEASKAELSENPFVSGQIEKVRDFRLGSTAPSTQAKASISHRFVQLSPVSGEQAIIVPAITSENRDFLPVTVASDGAIIGHKCYALYDAPLWNMALIASRLHWVWIGTVCVRMRTDFSYSNTLGWNTFPVPTLTEKNKSDLTACAEDILLAREAHFPATIADLYDPEKMPANLRAAHDRNDETLERIYIGRRFKNDTERLEKLFEMYTKMTSIPRSRVGKT